MKDRVPIEESVSALICRDESRECFLEVYIDNWSKIVIM